MSLTDVDGRPVSAVHTSIRYGCAAAGEATSDAAIRTAATVAAALTSVRSAGPS
jgi:hypothetical protein